jgi:hypothetical protein
MELSMQVLLIGGLAIAAIAWLWLIVSASREGAGWGLGTLFLPPLGLVFALRHAQRAVGPLVLFIVGLLAGAAPAFYALTTPVDASRSTGAGQGPWSLAVAALRSDAAHEWMENRALYLQLGGAVVAVGAWLWLIERAFRQRWTWGLGNLILPPTGLVFASRHPRKGAAPLLLAVLGVLAAAAPAVYTKYVPLDLAPRDEMVAGERHVTVTGSDRNADSDLALKPDVTVLQMANRPDVTDRKLEELLRGLKLLKEVDLNDTAVTDAGLTVLRDLPALERLRLARTKITDKGFRDALFDKDSLMQLDLQGTQVSSETRRAWRDARPGRRVLPPPG